MKSGTIVRKVDGPLMTVKESNGQEITCQWFVGNILYEEVFNESLLQVFGINNSQHI